MMPFIDLKAQYKTIKSQIKRRIDNVLEHGKFIMGPEVFELEERLAAYTGAKYCISCSSGTDALLLSLLVLGIKSGDEVIIPDFSFYATAEVISLIGAKPVFIDIKEDCYTMDPSKLQPAITAKTKAIITVSLYGQIAEMDEINKVALSHKIPVIEDAAQSFGAVYKGRKSGTLSDLGCTSFFPSKPLGCYGDGGAIFTNNEELALKLKSLRLHGQSERYVHSMVGINGRLDTIQAAVLLEKINIFDDELRRRREIAEFYSESFRGKLITPIKKAHTESAWAQYTIRVENREALCKTLKEDGVPTAIHYPSPLSQQPYYAIRGHVSTCQIADKVSKSVVSLPFHPYLEEKNMKKVIDKVLRMG